MNDDKIESLLLRLLEDMAYVKSKLESIEDQKFGSRIDAIEAQNREHDHTIKSLENRANKIEEFTRNQMIDSKKQMMSVYVSMGMALLSAVISFFVNLL